MTDHAATVRKALIMDAGTIVERRHTKALAALDALVADAEARDRLNGKLLLRAEAAEADRDRCAAELEIAQRHAADLHSQLTVALGSARAALAEDTAE